MPLASAQSVGNTWTIPGHTFALRAASGFLGWGGMWVLPRVCR